MRSIEADFEWCPQRRKNKKEEPPAELTPLEKLLQTGSLREDGSDKFFGLENVWYLDKHVSLMPHH